MSIIQRFSTVALMLLLNQACATSTPVSVFHRFDELEMSREFSSQTISSKPFVIHVVGLEKYESDQEPSVTAAQAENLLNREFQSLRADLKLQEPSLSAQERKELKQILKTFAAQQEFPAEGYSFLQKPSLSGSWFLIADVENMEIHHNISEEDIKDQEGKRVHTKYSYKTARDLAVRYFIYDPKVRHLVFTGLVRSKNEAVHDRVGSGDNRDYPEAPGMTRSLTQNFEKFLRGLPATRGH